jgi:predicted branched-subunit amino acid permease
LPLIAAGAPIWVVFATALVVNLRFVIFSALLGPHFAHLPWFQRFYLGYISGDVSTALFLQRYPVSTPAPGKLSFLKGLMCRTGRPGRSVRWPASSLAAPCPPTGSSAFAGTLAILCIMVPLVLNSAALCGVLVAGTVAVLAHGLPYKLGLLLAVLVGMVTAMAVEEKLLRRKVRHG